MTRVRTGGETELLHALEETARQADLVREHLDAGSGHLRDDLIPY